MATQTERPLWGIYEERYADLVQEIREIHISHGKFGGGHDFTHALMVARYAAMVAEGYNFPGDEERGHLGRLAWIAAICHNADRIWPNLTQDHIEVAVRTHLSATDLNTDERQLVVDAVLEHHSLNKPQDSAVTVVLKDADRLANLGPNLFIRSGQHYHDLPAYDPRFVENPDPRATYPEPMTVLYDILCALEWEPWLRCPKAIELAAPYFDFLREFKRLFEHQMWEVGFVDAQGNSTYPFPEDLELAYKQEAAH